jgi:G:T-mismatch repair DNA endonuclease (very short patch repair protein)
MAQLLAGLGEREDRTEYGGAAGTYLREHRLAPSRHADFAWPEKNKAIEVWGGVHTNHFFVSQQRVREANERQVERAKAAGWELMVVADEELRPERWDETRERVRRFLA